MDEVRGSIPLGSTGFSGLAPSPRRNRELPCRAACRAPLPSARLNKTRMQRAGERETGRTKGRKQTKRSCALSSCRAHGHPSFCPSCSVLLVSLPLALPCCFSGTPVTRCARVGASSQAAIAERCAFRRRAGSRRGMRERDLCFELGREHEQRRIPARGYVTEGAVASHDVHALRCLCNERASLRPAIRHFRRKIVAVFLLPHPACSNAL